MIEEYFVDVKHKGHPIQVVYYGSQQQSPDLADKSSTQLKFIRCYFFFNKF